MAKKKYRCVKSNDDDTVIATGIDENQGGQDYHGIGFWQDFVFRKVPIHRSKVKKWCVDNEFKKPLIKVVGNAVVLKKKVNHNGGEVDLEEVNNAVR